MGDAKVSDQTVSTFVDEDIPRLQITMNNSLCMRIRQRLAHIANNSFCATQLDGLTLAKVCEGPAGYERHREDRIAVIFTEIEYRNDVRMLKSRNNARLTPKAGQELGICGVDSWQHLQRHVAINYRLVCSVDGGHTALAQGFDDAVRPELASCEVLHGYARENA